MSERPPVPPALLPQRLRWLLFLPVFAGITAADLLTKELIFSLAGASMREGRFVPGRVIEVIPGCFKLQCVANPGAFSGWFGTWPWLLVVISVAALVAIALYVSMGRVTSRLFLIALACIAAGTAGNLYDRCLYGAVRDFFRFFIVLSSGREIGWYNFNVADASICVGVGLWILLELRTGRKKRKASAC